MKKILSSKLTLIITTLVFLSCSYWIFTNIKFTNIIDKVGEAQNIDKNGVNKDTSEEILVEDYVENSLNIFEIKDNKIFKVNSSDSLELILDMSGVDNIEYIGEIFASPDNKKICFTVQTIVPTWLYTFDLETKKLEKIDVAENCFWSPDGRYIAYNNHVTDVSPINVLIYDTEEKNIKNLSENLISTDRFVQCGDIFWLDSNKIKARCSYISMSDALKDLGEKYYVFDIQNGVFEE